jgi:hypothetical protein
MRPPTLQFAWKIQSATLYKYIRHLTWGKENVNLGLVRFFVIVRLKGERVVRKFISTKLVNNITKNN